MEAEQEAEEAAAATFAALATSPILLLTFATTAPSYLPEGPEPTFAIELATELITRLEQWAVRSKRTERTAIQPSSGASEG